MALIFLLLLPLLSVSGTGLAWAHAQSTHRVGLVVHFGGGSIITRCVEFGEREISGYDVLARSGLSVVAAFDAGMGAGICAIEDTGCPAEDCMTCEYPNYWSYWHLADGAWAYSPVGASSHPVHDGDVEGWSWGTGEAPPLLSFEQLCGAPATATPAPTDPPPPTPTHTPVPASATPLPPTATPAPPTATSPPPTPMVWFRLDANPVAAGDCTRVRWDTANAREVYLDGERVDPNGSVETCPAAAQEYHLRVVSATGEESHTLVLGVTGAASATPTLPPATAIPTSQATAAQIATVTASPLPSPSPSSSPSPPPPALSPTARPVALASSSSDSPVPSLTLAPQSTATPSPSTGPAETAIPARSRPTSTSAADYAVFGLIAVGLVVLLAFGVLRRG